MPALARHPAPSQERRCLCVRLIPPFTSKTFNLQCPSCGGELLHHAGLVAYDRHEDAPETVVTELRPDGSLSRYSRSSQFTDNPSSRRDGIAIRFWCEECGAGDFEDPHTASYELTIAQHKGRTHLSWRLRGS